MFRSKHKTIELAEFKKNRESNARTLKPFGFKIITYEPYTNEALAKSLNFKILKDMNTHPR